MYNVTYATKKPTPQQVDQFKKNFRIATTQKQFYSALFLELNDGCTVKCPFCQLDSNKVITRQMAPELIDSIGEAYEKNRYSIHDYIYFQFASDPGDYSYQGIDATSLALELRKRLLAKGIDPNIHITTAVPVGKEEWFFDTVERGTARLTITLSFSFMNEKRLVMLPEFQEFLKMRRIKKHEAVATYREYDEPIKRDEEHLNVRILGSNKIARIKPREDGVLKEGLERAENQMDFSRKVLDGRLQERKEFIIEYWTPRISLNPYCMVEMRNWEIDNVGRAYSGANSVMRDGSGKNYILVRPDGSIHLVESVDTSKDYKGVRITQLFEPIC